MKKKGLTVWQGVLAAFILLTVLFIWSNSLKTGTASGAQSGYFKNIFRQMFDITKEPFQFLYNNLRKVAHFAEFALLGVETAEFAASCRVRRLLHSAVGLAFCTAVAAIDEGIQLLVPGRAGALLDVGIDAAGALLGTLCVACLVGLVRLFKKK